MERTLTKSIIIAITLSEMELKTTERFAMMLDYILKFRKWLIESNCEQYMLGLKVSFGFQYFIVSEDKIDVNSSDAYRIKKMNTWMMSRIEDLKRIWKLYCLPSIAFTSASAIPADIGDFRTLKMEVSLLHVADLRL